MVRTRDDLAVLQDLPKGRRQITPHAFPITPTFDALSYFSLHWAATAHMALTAYVQDVQPLTFMQATPAEKADVVVVNLRYYHATYAADSSDAPDGRTHISMRPYQFLTRGAPKNTFYFADLYINNTDGLPSRVHFSGPDEDFAVDYDTMQEHWVVTHAHYEETVFGPLRLGALHVVADAAYDGFTFPSEPPDPALK
jgi:hypothetical protein